MIVRTTLTRDLRRRPMLRIRLMVAGTIATLLFVGSSLVFASPPNDGAVRGNGPVIGGGLGHSLKR